MFVVNKRVQPERKHMDRRKVLGISAVLILAVIVVISHFIDRPVHGRALSHLNVSMLTSKAATAVTSNAVTTKPTPPGTLSNGYFTLSLPAGYVSQTNNQAPAGMLYAQNVIATSTDGSLLIAIGLKQMPAGGLSADSSYALRSKQPTNYKVTSQTVNAETVQVSSGVQDDGVVAFWAHGSYLATISVTTGLAGTGASNVPSEQQALNGLLSGWQWQ